MFIYDVMAFLEALMSFGNIETYLVTVYGVQ